VRLNNAGQTCMWVKHALHLSRVSRPAEAALEMAKNNKRPPIPSHCPEVSTVQFSCPVQPVQPVQSGQSIHFVQTCVFWSSLGPSSPAQPVAIFACTRPRHCHRDYSRFMGCGPVTVTVTTRVSWAAGRGAFGVATVHATPAEL
jgi:hypothetical protein